MLIHRILAIAAVASLTLPSKAWAQSRPTTAVTPGTSGTLTLRAAIVLPDYTVRPLPLVPIVAHRGDRTDSVATRTDLDGRAVLTLPPGVYNIAARTPQPIDGRVYDWSLSVIVRTSATQTLELTNANATGSPVTALAAPSTAPSQGASPRPASNSNRQIAPEREVLDRVRTGVFRVEAGAGHGTGFLADTLGGVVITNDHVIESSDRDVSIYLDSVTRVPAQVLARDREADLAILRLPPNRCQSCARLRLAQAASAPVVETGERLLAIGFPLAQQLTLTSGIASSVREGAVISDVNINPGNSGGPLLNLDAEVVAINTFADKDQRAGQGVSGSVVVSRLSRALEAARKAIAETDPPADETLPVMPTRAYPLEPLKQHVATVEAHMYRHVLARDANNFTVTVQTPAIYMFYHQLAENTVSGERRKREERAGIPAEERYSRLKAVRDWEQYVGDQFLPVVTVRVSPKIGETGWSAFARALETVNYGTAISQGRFKFRGDLRGARFYRNGVEVLPLRGGHRPVEAFINDRWVQLNDVADEGFYVLPPELFAPDSLGGPAMVTMVFQDIKNPQSGSLVNFYDATAAYIWNDFVPYFQAASPERQVIRANPAVKSSPAPLRCSSQTGMCVPAGAR
jgi:S1-C subfamily serine protease